MSFSRNLGASVIPPSRAQATSVGRAEASPSSSHRSTGRGRLDCQLLPVSRSNDMGTVFQLLLLFSSSAVGLVIAFVLVADHVVSREPTSRD